MYKLTVNPNTGEWNGSATSQEIELYYEQKGRKYFNELLSIDELRQMGE